MENNELIELYLKQLPLNVAKIINADKLIILTDIDGLYDKNPATNSDAKKINTKDILKLTESDIKSRYIMAPCCHPIPGDDILGYIDNKNQIEIHKRTCSIATKLKSSFGNHILDAKWDMHRILFFDATIEIHGIDRKGMLKDVANVISDQLNVNIHKITISSDEGIFEGTIELKVHDRSEVKLIIDSLKKIKDIKEIQEIM